MFEFKAFLSLGILIFLLTGVNPYLANTVSAQDAANTSTAQEDQKTLDEIVVEGQQFEGLPPLPTGDFVLSPELVVRINGESGRAALHAYYEFVFDPVIVNDNGFVIPDVDPRRKRETLRPVLRDKQPRTGTHIKRIPPSFYKMTLEEGFYALTQINYRIQTRTTIIEDPSQPTALTQFEIESSLDDRRYCLAEGTLIFDVQEDTAATFGKVVIRGLGRDREQDAAHFPIVATDSPTTRPADGYIFAKDPDPVAWGVAHFDPDNGLCQNGEHFVTSGWPISENWSW